MSDGLVFFPLKDKKKWPAKGLFFYLDSRHRILDRLGTEDWVKEAPKIGRWAGAADWTDFAEKQGCLVDFWGSVLVWRVVVFGLVVEVLRLI